MTKPENVIVPDFDPARGGVAAFAFGLAERWAHRGKGAAFLAPVFSGNVPVGAVAERFQKIECDENALRRALNARGGDEVVLHYVGYGYAPNGCPHWLLSGLSAWRREDSRRRLNIYFHELATEEPWWTRTHWTESRQRQIIRGLTQLADRVATSCPYFAARLRERFGVRSEQLVCVPVPSTLAKPQVPLLREPKRDGLTALIFGLAPTRQRTWSYHRRLLCQLAVTGKLARIIIAGDKASAQELRGLGALRLEILARPNLDAEQFAAVATADFGLVWNRPSTLTKSTVFANLCALGVPTVIANGEKNEDAGLPISPVAIVAGTDRIGIELAAAKIVDPALRAELRSNASQLTRTCLSWDMVAERLANHFQS